MGNRRVKVKHNSVMMGWSEVVCSSANQRSLPTIRMLMWTWREAESFLVKAVEVVVVVVLVVELFLDELLRESA